MDNWKNVALIVSHPAHAALVTGMVKRYSPKILIVGSALVQKEVVNYGLGVMGASGTATFLDLDDADSYHGAIAKDYTLHVHLANKIYNWIEELEPDVVIGDAFELSNFQHDLTRFLIDCALRKYHKNTGSSPKNYEIPICCRVEEGTENLKFQTFPHGERQKFSLSQEEGAIKQEIAQWASTQDDFISKVCKIIPDWNTELYREVPTDRDYTVPPAGLKLHYDDRGIEEVSAGKYKVPISFHEHFVPLVKSLTETVC